MFSNLTIYALTASLLSQSPMLTSINKYSSNNVLRIQNAMTRNFATHFLYAKTQTLNALITKSSFSHYLHTPLHFQDSDYSKCQNTQPSVVNQTFDNCQLSYDETSSNVVVIMDSTFTKCINSHDSESGGAILFVKNGELTVHDTFFQTCSINGESVGGAICACKALGEIGYNMGHECAKLFHSHYCCYSGCFGKYGSAAFVASQNLELNYSSIVGFNPPTTDQPEGAQFDLTATNSFIGSEYVNSTGGIAKYCSAIEYRQAQDGFFRYQTLLNNTGSYVSTFTDLDNQVEISFSNYINSHLIHGENAVGASLIFVRKRSVTLSFISIQRVSFSGDDNNNYHIVASVADHESASPPSVTLNHCTWSSEYLSAFSNLLPNANTNSIQVVGSDDNVSLNGIKHLDLQDCKGAVVPPTREDLIEIIASIEASPTDTIDYTTPSSTEEIEGGGNNNENDSQQNDKDKGGFPVGAIAGIAVGAAAVVAGVVAFFVIRHHRLSLNPEGVNEVGEAETNIVSNDNPLYNHQQEDDPFQEDFKADAL